jgi:hypothetical protein
MRGHPPDLGVVFPPNLSLYTKSMAECIKHSDWVKWKEAIKAKLDSLKKREVFSAVMPTPRHIFSCGIKMDFRL